MGIFKLKGGVIFKYLENLKKFNFEKSDMTSFLSELIKNRKSIKGIPYTKKWAELDSPSDLKFFMKLPNFLIAGVSASGTNFLAESIRQHRTFTYHFQWNQSAIFF